MAQRGKLAIAAAVALIAIALLFTALLPREPKYQGLTMSQWLASLDSIPANEALLILGTNNLPLLLRRVGYDPDTDVLSRLLLRLSRLTGSSRMREIANRRTGLADEARMVIQSLGPKATLAIPQLERILQHGGPSATPRALRILASLGDDGLAVVAGTTTCTNAATRGFAAHLLALHPESTTTRSALTNLLNDPDPYIRGVASIGLSMPR